MNEKNKLNCNIIKDLLPSYLEGICSQDTKNIVDEHLLECEKCSRLKHMLLETELVSEQTERSQINYLKKSKQHFIKQGIFLPLILAALVFAGLISSVQNNICSPNIYYAFLPVLLMVTRAVIPMPLLHEPVYKKQRTLAAISILCTLYAFFITFIIIFLFEKYNYLPFDLTPSQTGPLIDCQLTAIALVQAVLYVTGLLFILRGKNISFVCMGIYLTGEFITLRLAVFLRQLSDLTLLYKSLVQPVILLLSEGICMILLLHAFGTYRQKKSSL